MNFTQLKYAITLANEGNFTKAAEKLYITQPTLSIQIKELEKELNQTLFIRTKKSITLTKEGELFITFARQTLKNYQKCQNDMIIDQNIGGKLKIGLYWMFGYNGFGEMINQFIDEHPYIKCYLVIDGSVTLVEKILNDEIDVAIIVGTYSIDDNEYINLSKSLDLSPLGESPLVLLANKNSELATKKTITLDELDNLPLFNVSKKSNMHQMIDDYFKKNDIKPNIIGNSSEAEICFQIAKYNLAYSFVTASTYENYADKENVVAVNILPSITRKLYMISSKSNTSQPLEIFKNYIQSNF